MAHEKSIYIKGARVHNLKNIEVEIPHEKLVVVTGLSGSGKSTLAFDTIFAEGQRRYVESLSAYARQFLGKISKPDVDIITGIAPAIAIEQKVNTRNPRSTVGTTTEIYDYLKLLYARIGHTFSPVSGQEVRCYSVDDVAAYIQQQGEGGRVVIAAPLTLGRGQGIIEKLTLLLSDGLMRVWTKGETRLIEDILPQVDEKTRAEEILVVIDRARIAADDDTQTRMRDSVARAFSYGEGICTVITDKGATEFSSRFEADGIQFEHPSEHLFSFNNPLGACPRCEGYGKVIGIDEDLVIPDKSKTIYEDAVACWRGETMRKWKEQLVENAYKFDFPIHTPFHELTQEQKRMLWRGNEYFHGLDDFFAYIDSERRKIQFRVMKARYTGKTTCPECGGSRLRREALYVKVGGKTVADLVVMPVDELIAFFAGLELDGHDTKTAARILVEIRNRLQYLADVGLGYLTLDRLSSTLSGGESQRINLSTSLGSNLTGSLYILDEPSIGLHPRDTNRLIKVLQQLRDLGNTVIVVEHEEEVIRAADYIVDIGPKAGYNGGEVVFSGTLPQLLKSRKSLTADYLTGRRAIAPPATERGWSNSILIQGARENNLRNIDVRIPLGVMTCITGVSGSGKSSLAKGILYPALRRLLFDVLEMTVDVAIAFFGEDKKDPTCKRIVERLKPLQDVGLGYIKLGQSSSTLSGGESQRVKLASFLTKDSAQGGVMFIFDEPTTGLHFHDINKLLAAFNALIERGHTIVIVEHNMDVIKCADWVVDLGPEAGTGGGRVVFEGTPRNLEQCPASYTGKYLRLRTKL